MKLEPIVVSLLDTDLYKFNMDQVIFHKHTDLCGQYYFKNDYVEFLRLWRPIRDYVTVSRTEDGELSVVVDGPLFSAMQFEIYLLEIINEVYFRMQYDYETLRRSAEEKLDQKIQNLNDGTYTFKFAEFGCRRRLSREWEDVVVRRLAKETDKCVYQGIDEIPLAYTNHYAMTDWYDEYQGDNGTALTDTITTDLFLLDFNRSMVNNYSGVRHDSGDPYEWGEKIIRHYERYGVDPKTKLLLFSDSLDFDRAQALYDHFKDRTKVSFGIGTFCSNDTCEKALNIVIKLQYVNGRPVAKLSDAPGKAMCRDEEYLEYLRRSVDFRLKRDA